MAEPTTSAELRGKEGPLPLDPNVNIPRHVRDAGARAEAIQRAVNGEAEPSVLAPPANPDAPIKIEQQPEPPKTMTVQQAPPVAPQPQVPSQPQQPDPQQPDPTLTAADWERNFYAMKGRYEKQQQDMAAMGEQMRRMESQIVVAQQGIPQTPAPQSRQVNLLTEEEIQEYGPEFIDVVRRAASEVAAPLQAEIQNLRGQLGTVQQETGNSFLTRMNATISGLVPNWEALNKDPGFVRWTSLPDVFSGAIRGELMQDAWNNGDAQRVSSFFRAYLAEEAAVDPQASAMRGRAGFPASLAPPAPQTPSPPPLSLEALAAPGRAQSVAQQPADKPVYTAADITRFYTDVAAGKWQRNEQQRALIDADIIAAQKEGRIIPDHRTARPMGNLGGGR